MSFNKYIIAAVTAVAVCSIAHAAPLITSSDISFGENLAPNPAQTVSGAPVTARSAFLGKLNGTAGSYGFEGGGWDLATSPLAVDFNDGSNGTGSNPITATLSGVGTVNTVDFGRFNTTPGGSRFLSVNSGTGFSLSFDTAIAAFGFFGTDVSDFEGTLTVYLKHAGSSEEDAFDVRAGSTMVGTSGSVLFWGFASAFANYDQIRFVSTGRTIVDVFGFDDFVVADRSQLRSGGSTGGGGSGGGTAPEPASLGLAGLALVAVAAARRRRR